MEQNIHKDHRKRVRELVNKVGLKNLPEHQQLEYLLMFAMPRIDVNPLAHRLIKKFGSLTNVLNASPSQLESIEGCGKILSQYLSCFKDVIDIYSEKITTKPKEKLSSPYETSQFFISKLRNLDNEEVLLAILDNKGRLINLEKIGKGNDFSATLSTSEIFSLLSKYNASNFVLAHNHPSTTASPSLNDDNLTRSVYISASLSGKKLCDHLIIGKNDYYSYAESGVLRFFEKELKDLGTIKPQDRGIFYGI